MRRIALIVAVPEGAAPPPGAAAWLARIARDERFTLLGLCPLPAPAERLPWHWRALLGAEAMALPAAPEPPLPDLPRLDPGALPAADLVLDLAHAPAALEIGAALPQGCWRIDLHAPGAGLPRGAPPAGPARLLRHRGNAAEVIGEAAFNIKAIAGRSRRFWRGRALALAEQALARLHAGHDLTGRPGDPPPPAPGLSTLPAHLAGVGRAVGRKLSHRLRSRLGGTPGQFRIAAGPGDLPGFDPAALRDLPLPDREYWADPFLFAHQGRLWLFFEALGYHDRLGRLMVGELKEGALHVAGALDLAGHHLSFPLVFAADGEIWMLPETHQAGRVEIWRATDFPLGWTRHATALEGESPVDSVLHRHRGQWWLFTNLARDGWDDHCSELHLYSCDGPDLSGLRPHPLNPVVVGSRRARAGGRLFEHGGRLYRPAQDNAHGLYGWGLLLMEVTALSASDYAERELRHITPDFRPGLIGCHHVDAAEGQIVLDLRRA